MTRLVGKLIAQEIGGTFALVSAYAIAFTWSDLNTLIVSLAAFVAALGVAVVNVIMALRKTSEKIDGVKRDTESVSAKADVITVKADEVIAKADVLTAKADEGIAQGAVTGGHVNSAATKQAEQIDALNKRVAELIALRSEDKERASNLAQQAIVQQALASIGVPSKRVAQPESSAEASLEQIDLNTSQTAKNTARTDIAVKEALKDK